MRVGLYCKKNSCNFRQSSVMKKLFFYLVFCCPVIGLAQNQVDSTTEVKRELTVILNNKTKFVGQLLGDDGREIKFMDSRKGLIYIPKMEVNAMIPYDATIDSDYERTPKVHTDKLYSNCFISNYGGVKKSELYYSGLYGLVGNNITYGLNNRVAFGYTTSIIFKPSLISTELNAPISKKLYLGTKLYIGKYDLFNKDGIDFLYGGMGGLTYYGKNVCFSLNAGAIVYDVTEYFRKYYSLQYRTRTNYVNGQYITSVDTIEYESDWGKISRKEFEQKQNSNYGYNYNAKIWYEFKKSRIQYGMPLLNTSLFVRLSNKTGYVFEGNVFINSRKKRDSFAFATHTLKFFTRKNLGVNIGIATFLKLDSFDPKILPFVSITKKFNLKELER